MRFALPASPDDLNPRRHRDLRRAPAPRRSASFSSGRASAATRTCNARPRSSAGPPRARSDAGGSRLANLALPRRRRALARDTRCAPQPLRRRPASSLPPFASPYGRFDNEGESHGPQIRRHAGVPAHRRLVRAGFMTVTPAPMWPCTMTRACQRRALQQAPAV